MAPGLGAFAACTLAGDPVGCLIEQVTDLPVERVVHQYGGEVVEEVSSARSAALAHLACGWQRLLADKTDRLLDAGPPANAMAHLLAMRARLALHTDMTADLESVPEDLPTVAEVTASVLEAVEAGEPVPALQMRPPLTDLDTAMNILLRLGHHLNNAPLFPIEHTAVRRSQRSGPAHPHRPRTRPRGLRGGDQPYRRRAGHPAQPSPTGRISPRPAAHARR
ncbi:hypothetical protein FE633_42975 [Streptomyces montanus]|uniref:Uncharacterized protein n=1 Tax=Streptomyces montanus TaxID=2580423 RepID=A0A5R9F920_9ACTN|nr:hypothetical protein [Streptomyces montanus]TLS40187.1 hypothetical protein FE633_42975 [Streptomyces montanus]